jgi:hypothetical protein
MTLNPTDLPNHFPYRIKLKHRDLMFERVAHDVSRTSWASGWFSIPNRKNKVRMVDDVSTCSKE